MEIFALVAVLLGIVISVALSAFFSGSEMALSSCNTVRLENEAEEGKASSKRALHLAEKFDDTLSTILVGNNLVNILASTLTTLAVLLITEHFVRTNLDFNWLGTLVVTIAVIIFGETIPKIVCKKKATRMAAKFSLWLWVFKVLFFPITIVVVSLVKLITMGIKEREEEEDEAAEELQSIIETAEEEGVLDEDRSELVSAAIDFKDVTAEEAMTSRVDMEAIDIEDSREEIIKFAVASTHSRIPVYEGSRDNVIGVVHLNHLLKAFADDRNCDIREVMMEPCFVYKTTRLPVVLNNLKKARQHLAIVTDEYSGTLGVITMEDVLEQIVGDIWDETDTVEEEVVERKTGELEVDGDMVIGDFLEMMELPEESFPFESQTVGGFVIEHNGDFPEEGYTFTYENVEIKVLRMDGRRVQKVLVKSLEPEEEE